MNNEIEQQSYIALENKEHYLTHQPDAASFNEGLDVLLSMAEALVQDLSLEQGTVHESIVEQHVDILPRHMLGWQHVSIAVLEQQTDMLYPVAVLGMTTECEQQWRESIQGTRIQSLLGDADKMTRLQAGEILLTDSAYTASRNLSTALVVAPIYVDGHLAGVLLLDNGQVQPHHTADELTLIKTISRLGTLVIKRERMQRERNNALVALREANEQLEHMNKIKSDFVSVVSHEFRSALTTIQGFSEMMCCEDWSVAEMKEFAVDIHLDAKRLSRMISDMLDLERMATGSMQLRQGWLDLNTIIMEVVNRVSPTSELHTLRFKLANALPVLIGDAGKLTQVIENLLDNAIKYSPDGGEVCISSWVEGGAVHVSVQDHGIGISADAINRIFERYERVKSDAHHILPGTGLGLSIVRQIVHMHGGQVWAESVLGEGSCFYFTVQFASSPMNVNGLLS